MKAIEEVDGYMLSLLGSCLSDDIILKVVDCVTFREAWKVLQQCFEKKTIYEPISLYRELCKLKANSTSEVSACLSEVKRIFSQLKNPGETVSDKLMIGTMMSALPESYETFLTVWTTGSDQSFDDFHCKLMSETEDQLLRHENKGQAFLVKGRHKKSF